MSRLPQPHLDSSHTVDRVGRFAGLDGLRAIAVSAVLLYHLSPGALPGGYIGVDVFFVLSGFLITALLLREHGSTGRISLVSFWQRRARRLLPALAVLLVVCCSTAWLIGGDVLVGLTGQVTGALTFSSNWLDIASNQSYFDETSPELFRNLWSLAVEEQFYVLWPIAVVGLLLLPRRMWRGIVVAAIAVASATAMTLLYVPADATRVYYGTDTHSFGLAIGALLAIGVQGGRHSSTRWASARRIAPLLAIVSLAVILIAFAMLPADAPFAYQGGLAAVALLTALTIAGSIVPGSPLGRALDLPPLRWIGQRSYGLYLWHWPVFVLVLGVLPAWPRTGASGWLLGGIALTVTVIAASLSYRFVEAPVRHLGFRGTLTTFATSMPPAPRAPRVLAIGSAALVLLLAGTAGTVAALAASPERSAAQTEIEEGLVAIADSVRSAPAEGAPEPSDAPVPGGDQITAIGDSVMLASAPELQAAFPGIQIDAVVSRQLAEAPGIVTDLLNQGALRPIVLIGLGTNGPVDRATLDELRRLTGAAHQIVVVNVQAPRGWTEGVNAELTNFARQHRDVELANWRDAIATQLSLLSRDQIHPGSRGGRVYAAVVRDALQRLAEVPPLLRPNDYGLAPRPE